MGLNSEDKEGVKYTPSFDIMGKREKEREEMDQENRIQLSDHFTYGRLIRFTIPTIASMIFLSCYSIVDGLFISNFAGKIAFASVNLVFPLFSIIGVFGIMIGTGGSAIIGAALGMGDHDRAKGYFSFFTVMCVVVGILGGIVGLFALEPLVVFLGAEPDMMEYCMRYGTIGMLTVPFFMLQFMFQSLFVTAEKPGLSFIVTVATGLLNIGLDAIFIIWLGWGVTGAAIATAIAEVFGGTAPLIYFLRPNDSLLRIVNPLVDFGALGKACVNGLSEFVSMISESIVITLYNYQLLRIAGADGVAAYGAIQYISFIFFAVFAGYNMGVQPVFSYNYGADTRTELKNLFSKSVLLMESEGLLMAVLLFSFAKPLASIFVGYDGYLLEMTAHGTRIYAILFITCGFNIFATGMFTALNNGIVSAICSFVRVIICECGAVLILPVFWGLNGIWASAPIAEIGATAIVVVFTIALRKKYGYA